MLTWVTPSTRRSSARSSATFFWPIVQPDISIAGVWRVVRSGPVTPLEPSSSVMPGATVATSWVSQTFSGRMREISRSAYGQLKRLRASVLTVSTRLACSSPKRM